MNHTSFDQRNEQIGLATRRGFIKYELSSGIVLYEANFPGGGGANCISLLSDSNLVAASGDDNIVGFQRQTVLIWDCCKDKVIRLWNVENPIDYLFFGSDCLVVVHGNQVNFYDCCDFKLTYTINYNSNSNSSSSNNSLSNKDNNNNDSNINSGNNNSNDNNSSSGNTTSNGNGRFRVALGQSLVALPSLSGDCLNISDYHDPGYILGSIPIPFSRINFFQFDPKGELIAIVVDEAKNIQLWSVLELKLIAKYKRGIRSAEVSGIAFDNLSNFFVMTTKRGTMHVFSIPTPNERMVKTGGEKNESAKPIRSMRSKFSYDLPKGTDFHCQFDIAGYVITGITDDGTFKQLRLDIEHGEVVSVCDRKLEL